MTKKASTDVSKIRFRGGDNTHVAEISLRSGQKQSPTYAGLRRHIILPRPDMWELAAASAAGPDVVFCLSWASLQAGVVAVWNVESRRWLHCSETEYAVVAMLVPDLSAILTLHCVSNYVTPLQHAVEVRAIMAPSDPVEIAKKWRHSGFDPESEVIIQASDVEAMKRAPGPTGIFRYGGGENFCAHDDGERLDFTKQDILGALRKAACPNEAPDRRS